MSVFQPLPPDDMSIDGAVVALVRQIARRHGGDAVATARPDAPSCIVATVLVGER